MRQSTGSTRSGQSKRRADRSERIAIIGAGVSGVAAGNVWKKCGYDVTIFEASDTIGGQWTKTYPGVTLQNTSPQYQFGEFPWPFEPDRHPTSEQILRYIRAAAEAFELDILLLQDLGISQWRKLPNVAAEMFVRYSPTDYSGIIAEYLERSKKGIARQVMPVDT